jgi:phosphonate transport system substrate-binding protein
MPGEAGRAAISANPFDSHKNTMMAWRPALLWRLCCALLLWGAGTASARTPLKYSFAVVPQLGPTELHRVWAPVLARLSRDADMTLELKVSQSITLFEAEFLKGAPDFAYMNPYHAVMAKQTHGYQPLLRNRQGLTGILLVHKNSPYTEASQLKNQTLGFPAPNAFGASLYMRALLSETVKIPFETTYLGTHPNVFRHVLRGDLAAGGSIDSVFNDAMPEIRDQLRIIFKTPEVASHPVVAHPRLPESARQALTQAFLALAKDPAGQALLKAIQMPDPVPAQYQRDYRVLEKLSLQKYIAIEKE